jgi:P27 family predicted phage terminase small subunit
MVAKIPVEVHRIHGTKANKPGVFLPEEIKQRIPFAEWANNPESFTREKFVKETAEYLFSVYGIGSDQDRHTLMMLADQLQLYIEARAAIAKHPLIVETNAGKTFAPNPYVSLANKAMDNAIKLMSELGLTPKSRLAANKLDDNTKINDFLKGPKFGT